MIKERIGIEKILKERRDVDESLTWDLSSIFKIEDDYNLAIEEIQKRTNEIEN